METPASVYQPSPREYPARIAEPEYPSSMLVRSVKHQGVFRWKKHDVFLSEVLWAERIGLLPLDDRWFTIYFAELPIASFDSRELRVVAWRKPQGFDVEEAGEGEASPSPASSTSKPWGLRQATTRSSRLSKPVSYTHLT